MARAPSAKPISPTVKLLRDFKKARAEEEKAFKNSNSLAKTWREASYRKEERRAAFIEARTEFTNLRDDCTRISDKLVKLEAVTVRNKADVKLVVELNECCGLLGVVRMREDRFDSGGPRVFYKLVRKKGLIVEAED